MEGHVHDDEKGAMTMQFPEVVMIGDAPEGGARSR
jgi:hypothetical protein